MCAPSSIPIDYFEPSELLPVEKVIEPHPWLHSMMLKNKACLRNIEWIAASMKKNGWFPNQRPLLVHDLEDGYFQAWCGMHRLEAAKQTGMRKVPAVVMKLADLRAAGFTLTELSDAPYLMKNERRMLRLLKDQRPIQLRELEDKLTLSRESGLRFFTRPRFILRNAKICQLWPYRKKTWSVHDN